MTVGSVVGVMVVVFGLAGPVRGASVALMVAEIPPVHETSAQPAETPIPLGEVALLLLFLALAATSVVVLRRRGLLRFTTLRPTTGAEVRDTWMILLIAGLLVMLANWLGAGSAYQLLVNAAPTDALSLRTMALMSLGGGVGALIAMVVLPAILPGILGHIGLRARARDAAIAVGAFALIYPIVVIANAAMRLLANFVNSVRGAPAPDEVMHDTLALMVSDPFGAWWWLLVCLIVVVTPVYEEILFRGFLQTALLRRTGSARTAIVATSVIFAVIHAPVVEWHGLVGLFVLSLALGSSLERTGRLAAPIGLHALFNGVNVAIGVG